MAKDGFKKGIKKLEKEMAARRKEQKRVQKLAEKQAKQRAEGGLEPTHAIISCPDCAAKLLVGVNFLQHRV
jgi:hypothetical protein